MAGKDMIRTTKEVVPVIYAYTTPEIRRHDGWTKIGETGRETGKRLDEQALTIDVEYKLEWKANAVYEGSNETFRDHDFHAYMQKQGIERLKGAFINCKVKMDIVERLNAYSESTKIPKTAIVEFALNDYLDKVAPKADPENAKKENKE